MTAPLPVEQHPFSSYIPEGIRYLLIGTFPGRALTQPGAALDENDWYYGTSEHSLWKILGEIYDRPLTTKQAKQELLADLKVGITDVVAAARRRKPNNNDADLEVVEFQQDKLANLLNEHPLEALFFTSQQAQKWFAKISKDAGFDVPAARLTMPQYVLPSPSPRYIQFKHGTAEERREAYRSMLPAKS